ncbi:MAG: Rpn family recombination-promoting nuclease/putative transposase [Acidobacteriota bacterium]
MSEPRDQHDRHFRRLFSHPRLVRDLLRAHLPGEWSSALSHASFTRYREIGVADDQHKRESDIVWRIRWTDPRGDPQTMYAFVLLEFQRTVERTMAVRLMVYLTLLYQDLLKSGEIARGAPLPAILPVVVYNGDRPWTAPTQLEDLIQDVPQALAPYRPKLQYIAIDLSRDRGQAPDARNLFALLGQLERSDDVGALQKAIARIARRLRDEDAHRLRDDLVAYINHTAQRIGVDADALEPSMEETSMLRENVKRWEREWLQQGIQRGRKIGKAEGMQLGRTEGMQLGKAEAQMDHLRLLRGLVAQQLEARFGALTPDAHRRVEQADADQLQRWSVRVVTADAVDGIFADD